MSFKSMCRLSLHPCSFSCYLSVENILQEGVYTPDIFTNIASEKGVQRGTAAKNEKGTSVKVRDYTRSCEFFYHSVHS